MMPDNMTPTKAIIKRGERYYAGGTVPRVAKKDIPLFREWGMFDNTPNERSSSMAVAFLAQPEKTGGVTGFLS